VIFAILRSFEKEVNGRELEEFCFEIIEKKGKKYSKNGRKMRSL
jgi:hypothetical protein